MNNDVISYTLESLNNFTLNDVAIKSNKWNFVKYNDERTNVKYFISMRNNFWAFTKIDLDDLIIVLSHVSLYLENEKSLVPYNLSEEEFFQESLLYNYGSITYDIYKECNKFYNNIMKPFIKRS